MAQVNFTTSLHSIAESTKSGISNVSAVEQLRKSRKSFFSDSRKSRKSIGAYTSLFTRKLVPPIGFYREADKFHQMQTKFIDEPDKVEALEEMWSDYQKYQIRKRFRWPPKIICKKFFWTTGYYADYQKESRATRLRKPGEDSSDDEFLDPAGQFQIADTGDDINVEEFERYRQAKKLNQDQTKNNNNDQNRKRMTRFFDESQEDEGGQQGKGAAGGDEKPNKNDQGKGGKGKALKGDVDADLGDRRPTATRLFDDNDDDKGSEGGQSAGRKKGKGKSKEKKQGDPSEEVETTVQVEYTLIKDPNKKKKKSKAAKSVAPKVEEKSSSDSSRKKRSSETNTVYIPGLTADESAKLAHTYNQALAAGAGATEPQLVARRKSVAKTFVDPKTGGATVETEVGEDEYVPARHSLTTLSTIWDTKDDTLKKQYSTHTLTVTNLPGKANIEAMAKLFPGAKVNLKTPKKPGDLPYATVRFKDAEVCKKYFLGDANNIMLDGNKLEIKPKVVKRVSISKR